MRGGPKYLIAISGLVVAVAVGAVCLVLTRPQPESPTEPEAPVAVEDPAPKVVEVEEPLPPPRNPPPLRSRSVVDQAEEEPSDDGEPGESPEDAERKRKEDKMVADGFARMSRQLALRPEQVEAAEKEMQAIEPVMREMFRMMMDMQEEFRQFERDAKERQDLSKEDLAQLREQKQKELMVTYQAAMVDILGRAINAVDALRPRLDPEQIEKLDKMLSDGREAQATVQRGDPGGF